MGRPFRNNPIDPATIPTPDEIGGSVVDPDAWAALPLPVRASLLKLDKQKFPEHFWDCYHALLERGHEHAQAVVGAWAAIGRRAKNKNSTTQAIARLANVGSYTTVNRWLYKHGKLFQDAMELRAAYWEDRIPDIDAATFAAAVDPDGTAADRKLAYQRAGVLVGEDAKLSDPWLELIAAREEVGEVEADPPPLEFNQEEGG